MMLQKILIITCLNFVYSKEFLDIKIKQGTVRGYKSRNGIFEFHGIPYATAPTGPKRFKAPLPPPTWEKVFEATERRIACPQTTYRFAKKSNMNFKDDCLITNVYVPATEKKDLPVVVYIHGGAYQVGFSDRNTANTIVKSKEIVAVNFNYRLGPHGFLCLGTEDAPGNAAMKDQVALLRWVRENIASFGGNPNSVTISGCSAGGSSVDLHLVSKMSRGLFHRAIAESGSCVASFSVQVNPIENAKYYAKLLNFSDIDDIEKLESFYKSTPLSTLNSVMIMEKTDASVTFMPCIEKDIGQEMFLDSYPFSNKLISYQSVPMLFGYTSMEGITRIDYLRGWKDLMNRDFSIFFPEDLYFANEEERREAGEQMKQYYFGNQSVDFNTAENFVDYFTDRLFIHAISKSLEKHVAAGNKQVFFYEYLFFDKNNTRWPILQGAPHCAQSIAVMDEINEDGMSVKYKHMKAIMRELWSNFIITG